MVGWTKSGTSTSSFECASGELTESLGWDKANGQRQSIWNVVGLHADDQEGVGVIAKAELDNTNSNNIRFRGNTTKTEG